MTFNPEITSLTYSGFVVLVDNEVAGTLALHNELQPGMIAALNSNYVLLPYDASSLPPMGAMWDGTTFSTEVNNG